MKMPLLISIVFQRQVPSYPATYPVRSRLRAQKLRSTLDSLSKYQARQWVLMMNPYKAIFRDMDYHCIAVEVKHFHIIIDLALIFDRLDD
jgi:hypothetical protein